MNSVCIEYKVQVPEITTKIFSMCIIFLVVGYFTAFYNCETISSNYICVQVMKCTYFCTYFLSFTISYLH